MPAFRPTFLEIKGFKTRSFGSFNGPYMLQKPSLILIILSRLYLHQPRPHFTSRSPRFLLIYNGYHLLCRFSIVSSRVSDICNYRAKPIRYARLVSFMCAHSVLARRIRKLSCSIGSYTYAVSSQFLGVYVRRWDARSGTIHLNKM